MLKSYTPYTIHQLGDGAPTIVIDDRGIQNHTAVEAYGSQRINYSTRTKQEVWRQATSDLKSNTPFSKFKREVIHGPPSFTTGLVLVLLNWFIFSFLFVPAVVGIELGGSAWESLFVLSTAHPEYYWTWITSFLTHGGAVHLLVNSIVLISFGYFVEEEVGLRTTLLIFVGGALVGNISQVMFALAFYDGAFTMVGASGGASAIFATAAILYKNMRIGLFFVIPMKIRNGLVVFMVGSIAAVIYGGVGAFGLGNIAHLGGLFVGLGAAVYYTHTHEVKQQLINLS